MKQLNEYTVDDILQLLADRGDSQYGGECVTQMEHALQAATLAEQEDASAALITAALLHDIGHLIHELPADAPDNGIDDHHETSGYRFVSRLFPPEVSEPIRMHVPAKRYLCAVDAEYQQQLSAPSITSLQLQGGPMSAEEADEFRRNPFVHDAVRLRRWDDRAKISSLPTPPLAHFVGYLRKCALRKQDA